MAGTLIARFLGFQSYMDKTTAVVHTVQETVYKALLVFLTFTTLIWISIFLYATFYYTYLPAVSHVRPVHLQFRVCGSGDSQVKCSFPSANVTLTHKEQFLAVGQPYRISLELEMPESAVNQNLGMFMVCGHLKNKDGNPISKSCRSAMLSYKSSFLHTITTFVFSPFLIAGSSEQKQKLEVELFSNFQEQRISPATNAYIEIQTHKIEIYRSNLKILAHFTGLRYFMFHWPFLSALMGIMINLFFLTIIAFLSWYKYFTPTQAVYQIVGYDENKAKELEEKRKRKIVEKAKLLRVRETTTIKNTGVGTTKEDLNSPVEPSEHKENVLGDSDEDSSSESNDDSNYHSSKGVPLDQNNSDEFEVSHDHANEKKTDTHSDVTEKKENHSESDTDDHSEDKENQPDFVPGEEDLVVRQRIVNIGQ